MQEASKNIPSMVKRCFRSVKDKTSLMAGQQFWMQTANNFVLGVALRG
ncbi:MAG: hypothetical protein RLZZ292_1896 [Bacteroidota bacterium]